MLVISTHKELINAVTQAVREVCGDKGDAFSRGVCFGYVATWLEAFLTDQIPQFYDHIHAKDTLSAESRQHFFFGMALHQAPGEFLRDRNHYHQDFFTTLPLVMSQALKDKGGLAKVLSFTGFYNQQELGSLLYALHVLLQGAARPAAWTLSGGKHSAILCFYPDKIWFVDANNPAAPIMLPCKTVDECERLAKNIVNVLTIENPIPTPMKDHRIITLEWICSQQEYASHKFARDAICASPLVIAAHTVNANKLLYPDPNGFFWLNRAVYANDITLVNDLLNSNVPVNPLVLHEAILFGHLAVSQLLVQRGVNPNHKDLTGRTALHLSILLGHLELFKFLLKNGADPRIETNQGMNALTYAKRLLAEESRLTRKQEFESMVSALEEALSPRPLHFAWSGVPAVSQRESAQPQQTSSHSRVQL